MEVFGINLDDAQVGAIKDDAKTVIVSAGAGSGKTQTILGKVKYLIDEKNVKENEILCISLTNETVNNLKVKLDKMNYKVDVMTFHKLGLSLMDEKMYIVNDDYLNFIIDEYMLSYIRNNKLRNKTFKRIFFTESNMDSVMKTQDYLELKKVMITFIKYIKSNDLDIRKIKIKHIGYINREILRMIFEIYIIYTEELSSSGKIDFDDMIKNSSCKKVYVNYKYIVIDEFQDTSVLRLNLIRNIMKYNEIKLFLVGDDWQSIYAFSGCTLDIFVNINKYLDNVSYHQLKYTYRNSQELITASGKFVMKNRYQLIKDIISYIHEDKPIIILYNYQINDVLKYIKGDVMIIGRCNKDIENIQWENKYTIHKSKGLEADNVILVNSDNIPFKHKSHELLDYFLKTNEGIKYPEERRLFYVALTRTKKKIYIMVNNHESIFIRELRKNYKEFITIKKNGKPF